MSDPNGLTHAVLLRVAEFLRDLPQDQLAALGRGDASLAVVPATGGTRPREKHPPAPVRAIPLPVSAEQVRAALAAMTDRASAARYLDELRLGAVQLRSLAKELGLAVAASAAKGAVRDTIVQWTVGRRVDATLLSRATPTPFPASKGPLP